MPKKKTPKKINLHGLGKKLDDIVDRFKRVRPQTATEKRYHKRKLRELKAFQTLIRSRVFCPETWGVWPEDDEEAKKKKKKKKR